MHILILIVGVTLAMYLITRNYAEFVVTIENGKIIKQTGRMPSKMLSDFESALSGVKSGKVLGNKSGSGLRLSFRGDINEFTEQRLRNIVGLYYG